MKFGIKSAVFALTAILLSLFCFPSCDSSREFSSLSQFDDVDVLHIPKGMTYIASTFVSKDNLAKSLLRGAGSLDIVNCEGRKNKERILAVVKDAVSASHAELILEVNENKESVRIYGNPDTKKNKLRNVIIVSDEPGDLSVVRLNGSINLDTLVKATLEESLKN